MKKNIFISTGELSGDIHAAKLVNEFSKLYPYNKYFANGGDNLKSAGSELLFHINDISFMGFAEVIKHLLFIRKIFTKTISYIKQKNIDLVILKKLNIPVIYYICPQIWAWHQSRVKILRKYIDKVLCILPFEPVWFLEHGVDAEYIGHPLMDKVLLHKPINIRGLAPIDKFIGLFPGSRVQELENHLAIMIDSAREIRNIYPNMNFVVGMAPGRDFTIYQKKYHFPWLKWAKNKNDEIMQNAEYLITVSGTASLEAALIRTPMLIIYKTSTLTYYLARLVVKIKHIGLANLIVGRKGIHELVQKDVSVKNITSEVVNYFENSNSKVEFDNFFDEVHEKIGKPGASERAVKIIAKLLDDYQK